jgi:hypothetical protein
MFNYDQIVDGEEEGPLADILTMLIDDTNQPLGEMCQMRVAKEDDPNQTRLDFGEPYDT